MTGESLIITLDNYIDFYNSTRAAKIKTVRAVRHVSIPALLQPYITITVKASVDTTIFVCHIMTPDISKIGIDNTREVQDNYLFSIYNELKASGYVDGDIESCRNGVQDDRN